MGLNVNRQTISDKIITSECNRYHQQICVNVQGPTEGILFIKRYFIQYNIEKIWAADTAYVLH